jgi:hypothetical protein
MSTTTRKASVGRLFDGILERQANVFDAIRSNNDRVHRFNRSLIEGARQGGRDWTEVGRRWATNPADFVGLYESLSEALGSAQARTLALAREWIDDVVESQRETREVVRQGFGDVREAMDRAQANVPPFLRRNRRRANGQQAEAEAEAAARESSAEA